MAQMLPLAKVASIIENAAIQGRPFCFVRLGDGEGTLLSFTPPLITDDKAYFESHFGTGVSVDAIMAISQNLVDSIEAADLVGLRDDMWRGGNTTTSLAESDPDFLARFRAEFPLRECEKDVDLQSARRLFRLFRYGLTRAPLDDDLCSSWVCYDLALMGFWEALIVQQGSIGLIHCSPDLPVKITAELGVDVESIQVPDKAANQPQWRTERSRPLQTEHYPEVFIEVRESLSRPLYGKVFFVGAGIIGKSYLKIIKDNGGIGIDVGALLDAWDGRATRPLVYQDKLGVWGGGNASPEVFRLHRHRRCLLDLNCG